jgi:hypothetical protein
MHEPPPHSAHSFRLCKKKQNYSLAALFGKNDNHAKIERHNKARFVGLKENLGGGGAAVNAACQ